MPEQSTTATMDATNAEREETENQPEVPVAKIQPKAVFWVVFAASMLALVMFSLLFLHTAARNGWGPFGG